MPLLKFSHHFQAGNSVHHKDNCHEADGCVHSRVAGVVLGVGWEQDVPGTGPGVDVRDDAIVLDKGKEGKWEIARDANTKVNGTLQKGAKVTVYYRRQATEIEAKETDNHTKQ